jgi:LPXTG-motif cell wall-anchored protein
MKRINRFKLVALIFCASLVALAFPFNVEAQTWNKRTIVTFSQRIEIPGVGQHFLPAGKYVFKLVDSLSSRDIVQIFNEDETHVFATILTIANYRLKATDETVMTFRERPAGQPEAIRAWFYPGANWGQEFVYPKTRAVELAKATQQPVLYIPAELAPELAKPVPELALKEAPIRAVTPRGEEVEIAQVVGPPPSQAAPAPAPVQTASAPPVQTASARPPVLPQTASPLPLFGLIGLLSLGAGFALSVFSKRNA